MEAPDSEWTDPSGKEGQGEIPGEELYRGHTGQESVSRTARGSITQLGTGLCEERAGGDRGHGTPTADTRNIKGALGLAQP